MFHDSGPPPHHRPVVPLRAGHHLRVLPGREAVRAVARRPCSRVRASSRTTSSSQRAETNRLATPYSSTRLPYGSKQRYASCAASSDCRVLLAAGSRRSPASTPRGCRRPARGTRPGPPPGRSRFQARSQRQNRATSAFAHIQVGQRSKRVQRALRVRRAAGAARHRAVHPVAVGPVALHRDEGEPALGDQPAGELLTQPVVVVTAVASPRRSSPPGRRRRAPATGRSRSARRAAEPACQRLPGAPLRQTAGASSAGRHAGRRAVVGADQAGVRPPRAGSRPT